MRPNGLVLNPVATERVSDVIAERLTTAIREGTLKPGDRLPTEAELAREFQVGRTSVREGLQKLRAHGLIESRKGLGAFVTDPPASDPLADFARWTASDPAAIEQLVEARVALETLAAALAALRATDAEIDDLERLNVEHAAAESTTELVATDQAFHAALMACRPQPLRQRRLRGPDRRAHRLPREDARAAVGQRPLDQGPRRDRARDRRPRAEARPRGDGRAPVGALLGDRGDRGRRGPPPGAPAAPARSHQLSPGNAKTASAGGRSRGIGRSAENL